MRFDGDHARHWSSIAIGCFAIFTVVLIPALAVAQGAAQSVATILGQVTDESGAALPGVTVTLRSPALQVPSMLRLPTRAANTDWRHYRSAYTRWTTSWPDSRPCG